MAKDALPMLPLLRLFPSLNWSRLPERLLDTVDLLCKKGLRLLLLLLLDLKRRLTWKDCTIPHLLELKLLNLTLRILQLLLDLVSILAELRARLVHLELDVELQLFLILPLTLGERGVPGVLAGEDVEFRAGRVVVAAVTHAGREFLMPFFFNEFGVLLGVLELLVEFCESHFMISVGTIEIVLVRLVVNNRQIYIGEAIQDDSDVISLTLLIH